MTESDVQFDVQFEQETNGRIRALYWLRPGVSISMVRSTAKEAYDVLRQAAYSIRQREENV